MRRIHKEDLWKIYLTLWGGSFVPVYMLSFPLVSWLICDVLALFFCLIASPRIQGLPFDLQKERSSGMCLERIAIGISLKRKKGWGYPAVLKERDKSTGFFFLFFLPVLERERLGPSGCSGYYNVNALLQSFNASLGSTVHASTGHQKTCELQTFTCKSVQECTIDWFMKSTNKV